MVKTASAPVKSKPAAAKAGKAGAKNTKAKAAPAAAKKTVRKPAPAAPVADEAPYSVIDHAPPAWLEPRPYMEEGPLQGTKVNTRVSFPQGELDRRRESLLRDGQQDPLKIDVWPEGVSAVPDRQAWLAANPPHTWTEARRPRLLIVDGETTWRAILGTDVRLRCSFGVWSDAAATTTMRATGTERKNLTPLAVVRAWKAEMALSGMGATAFAESRGLEQSTFSNMLRLDRLPERPVDAPCPFCEASEEDPCRGNCPAEVRRLVDAGNVSPSSAWNHLVPFAPPGVDRHGKPTSGLRLDLSFAVLGQIASTLNYEVNGDADVVLEKGRVRDIAYTIAARLSYPVRKGTGAAGDVQPTFEPERHAECGCGGPSLRYHAHVQEHERCFDIAPGGWYDRACQEARAAARAEAEARAARDREAARREVESEYAPEEDEVLQRQLARTATLLTPESLAGLDMEDEPVGQAGARGAGTPDPSRAGAALPAAAPLPAYQPGQVLSAEEMRRCDPDRSWTKLGTWDGVGVSGVRAAEDAPLADVPVESIRYVYAGDSTGALLIYCADPAAIRATQAATYALSAELGDRARREIAQKLREDAEAARVRAKEESRGGDRVRETAAVLSILGRTTPAWLPQLAKALLLPGEWHAVMLPQHASALRAELVGLKGDLSMLASVVALCAEDNDGGGRVYRAGHDATTRATALLREACTERLRALIEAAPPPDLPPDTELARRAAALESALNRARGGAANPKLGRATAGDFPARVAALEEADLAMDAFFSANADRLDFGDGEIVPEAIRLVDRLQEDTSYFLAETPDVILLSAPDARTEHLLTLLRRATGELEDARRTAQEAEEATYLAHVCSVVRTVLGTPAQDAEPLTEVQRERVDAALADADALLADVAGKSATLFGTFEAVEGEPAEPQSGASAVLAGLVAQVREAKVHAETVGIDAAAEAAALERLEKAYREANQFFTVNEGAEYTNADVDFMENDVPEFLNRRMAAGED